MEMNKSVAVVLSVLAAIALGAMFFPGAFAGTPGSVRLAQGYGPGYGMGPGMMGGGMMGGGMMGQPYGYAQPAPATVNPKRADELLAYIRDHRLACMQCHGIAGGGFGPPFAMVSAGYANRPDAVAILADHIANGFGRMPGGQARPPEAARLAKMIVPLGETSN
jgi:cytochrome c551/c552